MTLHPALRATLALAAFAAGSVQADPTTAANDFLKGKVREGYYDVRNDSDLSNVPSIPKEQAKSSSTRKVCWTRKELDRGVTTAQGCSIRSFKPAANGATMVSACKDGSTTEMKWAFSPAGYTADMKTVNQEGGKTITTSFRTEAKFIGPCPPGTAKD